MHPEIDISDHNVRPAYYPQEQNQASKLIDPQPQFLQLLTVLHVHIPRSFHRLVIDIKPSLRILHSLPLLMLFVLTPHINRMDILVFRLANQFLPVLWPVVIHFLGVDVVVYVYPVGYAFLCVRCAGLLEDERGTCGYGGAAEEGG